jgi:predicted AAA+ superfamily ATPase
MESAPSSLPVYRRPAFGLLRARLEEPRRFIQVIAGPRQVGKTTLVRQVVESLPIRVSLATADDPGLRDAAWLDAVWEAARVAMRDGPEPSVLVLDEIQKVSGWADVVKRNWDADSAAGLDLRVVVLGSAPLLVRQGLAAGLAGRFELLDLAHWSFAEMRDAFSWDLERFLFFGGYPGAAPLVGDVDRWRSYILESLVETTLARDVLLQNRVDKPVLLRRLFRLACDYSGQVLSYQKFVGQLQDAGNTTTLARYLRLLGDAGLVTGLEKYAGSRVRQRGSSPKLLALDTGLMTAMSTHSPATARTDPDFWGRLVETAVGAHLSNTGGRRLDVTWWRERQLEVDFVVADPSRVLAIEVASGRRKAALPGLRAFSRLEPAARTLLVGGQGLALEKALTIPAPTLLETDA